MDQYRRGELCIDSGGRGWGRGWRQTSAGVNVVIQPSADQFGIASSPASQTVALGGSVTFTVGTTGTNGVAYQWSHNQAPITGATASTLVVGPPIADGDAGTYTVTATVPGETLTSAPAYLTVVDPPVITTQPTAQTIPTGSGIVLTVGAAGGGPFTYQWRLNGVDIPGATNSTYIVPSAQPLNSGKLPGGGRQSGRFHAQRRRACHRGNGHYHSADQQQFCQSRQHPSAAGPGGGQQSIGCGPAGRAFARQPAGRQFDLVHLDRDVHRHRIVDNRKEVDFRHHRGRL